MNISFSDLSLFEIAGVFGFALYVMNYIMLTFRHLTSDCITYFAINFCAASLVLIGLTASFNLAAALLQGFWIIMSAIAISLRLMRHRRSRLKSHTSFTSARPPAAPFQSAAH